MMLQFDVMAGGLGKVTWSNPLFEFVGFAARTDRATPDPLGQQNMSP